MTTRCARKPYPSDVIDSQWAMLAPFLPEPGACSPRESMERCAMVNGILPLVRTGCPWKQMPHDLPNEKTVDHAFRAWTLDGT